MKKRSNNPQWRKRISESRIGKFKGEDNAFYGKHHSEETKQHLSRLRSKPIEMLMDGKVIMEFPSTYAARDYLLEKGATKNTCAESRISKCLLGRKDAHSAYGFQWRFKQEGVSTIPFVGEYNRG